MHLVRNYNDGRTRAQLLIYPTTAYLTGWEWPAANADPAPSRVVGSQLYFAATHGNLIPTPVRIVFEAANIALLALAALGLIWALRTGSWRLSRTSAWLVVWLILPTFVLFEIATHPNRLIPFHGWAGIWMPRYLGFVWPAGAILICTLFASLPGVFLRRSAMMLLLGINCLQSVCLVTFQTRPPTQRMMQDVWQARDEQGPIRTYLPTYPFDPEGGGTVLPGAGKYYLCMAAERPLLQPETWLKISAESTVPIHASDDPTSVAEDVRKMPSLEELVVWRASRDTDFEVDELERLLGPQWKQTADETFHVRGVWNWSDLYICRRCRYVRSMSQ